ncbi:MAG: AAA family ATPase [Dolichospermum sp.]
MLRLNKLTLSGFKTQTRQASVDFSSEKISVIYGDNGCGKTSFLKILHGIFSQDENILKKENVETVEINFTYEENNGTIENSSVFIRKNSNNNDESNEESHNNYDWNELKSSKLVDSKSLSIDVQRGINSQHIYNIYPETIYHFVMTSPYYSSRLMRERFPIKDFCKDLSKFISPINTESSNFDTNNIFLENINISEIEMLLINRYKEARDTTTKRVQAALFDTLALAIGHQDSINNTIVESDNFKHILSNKKERIIEALKSLDENKFKNEIIKKLSDEELDNIFNNNLFSKLLYNMIQELEQEEKFLSSINLLIDTFNNKFLMEGKQLKLDHKQAYIKFKNGEQHSLNKLSSGERHLLTFLTLALIEGEKRDFLIIDEPEISLNTKWQKNLLPLLTELIPNTQIIVASHSPAIAYKNQKSLVKLEIKEN